MEDQATFSSVQRACELAHERAGVEAEALHASVLRIAAEVWRAAPIYAYAEEMGMRWGESLWDEFRGDAPGLRSLRAFVPGFRRDVWRGALAATVAPDEALGAEREGAVVIGDSITRDVAGARGAGLRSIWIDRGGESPRPDDAVPDARVTALSQIRSCLAAWEPGAASPRGSL